jgi:hypothetical protein
MIVTMAYDEDLAKPGARPLEMRGREMKGFARALPPKEKKWA